MSEFRIEPDASYDAVLADLRWRREIVDRMIKDLEAFWFAKKTEDATPASTANKGEGE